MSGRRSSAGHTPDRSPFSCTSCERQDRTSLSSAGEQPQWVDLKVGGATLTGDRMLHHTGTVS